MNLNGLNVKVVASMTIAVIIIAYIFLIPTNPAGAQTDGVHNFPVSARELPGSVEFSGVIQFKNISDTVLFTQAFDISYYNILLPIYAYFKVGDQTAEMLGSFEGTSSPGVFDSTFFREIDLEYYAVLVTGESEVFLSNYEEGCPTNNVGICFNEAFGCRWIRLRFNGLSGNTIGASVNWSVKFNKLQKSSESRAFSIVNTRSQ